MPGKFPHCRRTTSSFGHARPLSVPGGHRYPRASTAKPPRASSTWRRWPAITGARTRPWRTRPELGDTAVYLYTSGTTGLPKAAPGSHRKFIKAYGSFGLMSLAMTPEDVLYVTLPFYHGTALLICWGSALAGGSAVAMRRTFQRQRVLG